MEKGEEKRGWKEVHEINREGGMEGGRSKGKGIKWMKRR